ncbi:peptide deformylase [Candidatus Microgenomates bacterium]|nr:MAG: peptide deformylase [Candidatus Microgenomates bacterium]
MILKFSDIHDPILRKNAKPVKYVDKKIAKLIADMRETLVAQNDPEGIGLAAPQVGRSLRLFIVDYEKLKRVVINPKIISITKPKKLTKKDKTLEGCLSLPHYYGPIGRSEKITINYLNEEGKKITETFVGFPAHIIQHEIDHLNGILFIDHILKQNAPLYQFKGDEWEEVDLI